jgi:hypothetical protein
MATFELEPITWDLQRLRVLDRPGSLLPLDGAATTLDDEIAKCGYLGQVLSQTVSVADLPSRTVDSAGVAYQVAERKMRTVNDVVDHAYLQDVSAEAWPGAVIQGGPLTRGDTATIGLHRAPGVLSIVTDIVAANPGQQSVRVESPSAASIGDARRDLLQRLKPKDSPGILNAQYMRVNTLQEAGVKLGLNIRGASFGLQADASLDSSYKTSTVVASIRQTYYVAAFEPEAGGAAASAFDASVTVDDLEPFIGAGNPPLMISRVHYGRVIVVTATAAASSEELSAALKAQWDAAVSGNVSISGRYKELVDSAQVRVYAVGATSPTLPQDLTNPVQDLDRVYRDGLALSVDNPGAPIAFSARHLMGGSLAHVQLVAEYVQPVSAIAGDVDQPLQVWDGPGGGAVDTGIDVAPGDQVSISASGQVWSGTWFTGTHGPEGWPNWTAPAGAPNPALNTHCLIGKFGSDPRTEWFKVANFWNGTNATGSTGRLQLNVNDDNPYNGDPARRFDVKIVVKRRPAAAAGIYV